MSTVMTDQELAIFALRAAQLILADYVDADPHDSETTIKHLLDVLDRNDVVEAVDRLEDATGLRMGTKEAAPQGAICDAARVGTAATGGIQAKVENFAERKKERSRKDPRRREAARER
jgi:hypothetical protein